MDTKHKHDKPDPYRDYPCRKCDLSQKSACCGCPEEREWRKKHNKVT